MKIFTEKSEDFLERYLNNPSPSGFERSGQKLWLEYISPYIDNHLVDNYGTVVGVINPEAKFKVALEAHADEIGWTVSFISKDGLIYVDKLGGSDVQIAPAQRVKILTRKGVIEGVFGWTATHIRNRDKVPMVNNIFIDVGVLTAKKVKEMGVEIGDPIVFNDGYKRLNNKRIISRGLDNRIGGFIIAQVAKMLKESKTELPFGVYFINSVQEEVGKNGAKMIAEQIKPNVAIVTDVTHDTSTPGVNPKSKGDFKISRGPVLTQAPPIHKKVLNMLKDIADENEIKYQNKTASKITGTDADEFAYSGGGIPTGLISLPIRYMHQPSEMASTQDVEKIIHLMYHFLQELDPEIEFNSLED